MQNATYEAQNVPTMPPGPADHDALAESRRLAQEASEDRSVAFWAALQRLSRFAGLKTEAA